MTAAADGAVIKMTAAADGAVIKMTAAADGAAIEMTGMTGVAVADVEMEREKNPLSPWHQSQFLKQKP
jgi:hypothetical protein